MDSTVVAVAAAETFDPETDFRNRYDQFKDALVLPNDVFDRLFGPERTTGYVRAEALDSSAVDADPLYAIRFADEYEPPVRSDAVDSGESDTAAGAVASDTAADADVAVDGAGVAVDGAGVAVDRTSVEADRIDVDTVPLAYLRLNAQDAIGCDAAESLSLVRVSPVDAVEAGPLTVRRDSTYRESTEERVCRVNPALAADLGFEPGETVEIVSSRTSGRVHLELRTSPTVPEDAIALSTHARKLLGVRLDYKTDREDERTVTLRRPHGRRAAPSAIDRIGGDLLSRFVGYNELQLRTVIGLNTDENRDTVRADPETLDVLGIEPGDRVVVESFSGRTAARCLPLESDSYLVESDDDLLDEDINPTTILLPSTERSAVDVLVDDVVSVRRDMTYVTGKRVVPSILGILGVFLTGLQALGLVDADLASPAVLFGVGASFVGLSLLMVWVVLWPERQKCSL